MATVNYSTETSIEGGFVKVEWTGMGPNDDGQPFDCGGLKVGSIHYTGDYNNNAGRLTVMGSNQLSPSEFGEFMYSFAPRIQLPTGEAFMGAVRPVADGNITSVGVAIIFVQKAD